jgi:hypothetical protein
MIDSIDRDSAERSLFERKSDAIVLGVEHDLEVKNASRNGKHRHQRPRPRSSALDAPRVHGAPAPAALGVDP